MGACGVYTPVTLVSDVWLSEEFVRKGFFASFLLSNLPLASLCLSFLFLPYFCGCSCDFLVGLDFVFFLLKVNSLLNTVYVAVSLGDIIGF